MVTRTCGTMVEGNVVSFACDLEVGHDGPCRAVENAKSVRERKKWEEDQRHAQSGLAQFQGRAETTAERYTENPTAVPGPQESVQTLVAEDVAPMQDRAEAVVLSERTDGSVQFRQATSAEARVAGVPGYLSTAAVQPPGCRACQRDDHVHCQYIEDNIGAVDAEDFIPSMCPCFNQNPAWHSDERMKWEEESHRQYAERTFGPRPTKQREGDQVLPTPTQGEYVQDRIIAKIKALVDRGAMDPASAAGLIAQMKASKEVGTQRYGTPLQTFNGRDTLQDAVEEARDLFVYLSSLQQAREAERDVLVDVVTQAILDQNPLDTQRTAEVAVDAILKATGGMG
jgi:hypothetical protein